MEIRRPETAAEQGISVDRNFDQCETDMIDNAGKYLIKKLGMFPIHYRKTIITICLNLRTSISVCQNSRVRKLSLASVWRYNTVISNIPFRLKKSV